MPSTEPDHPQSAPDQAPPRPVQRTAAYGVVRDSSGAVLLLRAPGGQGPQGGWTLPGGLVRHGEHPLDRVRAGLLEQTGLHAADLAPFEAGADVVELPAHGVSVHTLRLLFDVTLADTPAAADDPEWTDRLPGEDPSAAPTRFVGSYMNPADLPAAQLPGFVVEALLPVASPDPAGLVPVVGGLDALHPPIDPAQLVDPAGAPDGTGPAADPAANPGPDGEVPVFVQRPAAYTVLVDESAAGGPRMLLSRLAGSAATWTLPGGGIDHGEHPRYALRREIHEEAGLPYTPGPLIDISSRHFVGRAPHGRLEDFHAVRLIYAGSVPLDRQPEVIEVDGSTEEAAWLPIADLERLGAVPTVLEALNIWREHRNRTVTEAPGPPW